MMAELGTLFRYQWRLWRNVWLPGSRHRRHRIGTLVLVPLFMGALYAGTRFFLNDSGLLELFSLASVVPGARRSATALTIEALSMSATTTFVIICLGALDQAFESFYLAPDLVLLLSAPISRRAVFASKLIMNLRWDATMVLVMAIPVWVAFAVWVQAPPVFYLALVAGWLLLLLVVSGLGTLLAMVLARFVPRARLRQVLLSFALSVGLLFMVLIQGFVTGAWTSAGVQSLLEIQLLASQSWLPSVWLSRGLVALMLREGGGWPWWLALAGCAGILVLGAFLASTRFYSQGWSHVQESESSPSRRRHGRGRRRRIPALWALVGKDLRLYFRQPMQWYQAILGTIVMTMVLLNFRGQEREDAGALMLSLVMAYVGASTFAMNLSLRGIAREGPCWWIVQVSPLSEADILRSKFLTAFMPTAAYSGLALVAMQAVLRLPWYAPVLSLPILLVMLSAMIVMNLAVGVWRTDFSRATETRNADVASVLVSQLLNYLFLSPGMFLLAPPPVLNRAGLVLEMRTALALSGTVFLALGLVVGIVSWRSAMRGLRSLRISEQMSPSH